MTIRSLILTTALASFVSFGVPQTAQAESVMCTMDAKLCPDGSSVGRTGPNCEFAPCPGEEADEDSVDDMDDMDDGDDSDDMDMPEDSGDSDSGGSDDGMDHEAE
ncbi:MAG: hypothetical protein EP349_09065 [Alphaproteobacteria bacterium]|nr:MAG: hypothetical protein EP349_09065 [Alphaproteobacteria bacterium]